MILKLEGRLAGPWVAELDRLWQQKAEAGNRKKIALDLRETTFADAAGLRLLRAIHAQTGADLLTATPWTEYLAEEVQRTDAPQTEEA